MPRPSFIIPKPIVARPDKPKAAPNPVKAAKPEPPTPKKQVKPVRSRAETMAKRAEQRVNFARKLAGLLVTFEEETGIAAHWTATTLYMLAKENELRLPCGKGHLEKQGGAGVIGEVFSSSGLFGPSKAQEPDTDVTITVGDYEITRLRTWMEQPETPGEFFWSKTYVFGRAKP